MKIALAHKRLDLRGGTERDFFRTAEGLRDLGHEVHLFCGEFDIPAPPGTLAHKVPVLPLGRTARLLSFAIRAPLAIRPYRCDVVVGFGRMIRQDVVRSEGGSHLVFLEKMKRGEGTVRRLWHEVSVYHRSVLAVERRQFGAGNYKKILAISAEVQRELTTTYGVPAEKIAVIHSGVDHERFHPRNRERARARVRKEWGIPAAAPLALFVGNGFQRKGLDRILRSWESEALAGVYLLVVGDDAGRSRYVSWAKQAAPERIVFAGRQATVEDYYAAADLLVLPAFQEAFGNVILEALASGLPVVTSRTVGAAEVLTGGLEEGILADADDAQELARKILRMLEGARSSNLPRAARETAERHSWKRYFQELEAHLRSIAEPVA
ncbi:MAG TPA: glycosyltransferase family 4 protein [Candidatus Binatia bacterium]